MRLTTTLLEDATREQIETLAVRRGWTISQTVKYLVESRLNDELSEVHKLAIQK